MFNINKLEKILNQKIISLEETSYGVSNKNYIITTDTINISTEHQKIQQKLSIKQMKKKL